MMRRFLIVQFSSILFMMDVAAQEPLPEFTVALKPNNKVLISWHNQFQSVTQISIQRSFDSLRNFTTFLTVPDPVIPENGLVDSKAPRIGMFYRLFIVLENGNYIFSKAKRAVAQNATSTKANAPQEKTDVLAGAENERVSYQHENEQQKIEKTIESKAPEVAKPEPDKIIYIKNRDSLIGQILSSRVRKFRDSILTKTKDTIVFMALDTILVKNFIPKEVYKISNFVFAGKDGNVMIALPDAENKKYSIRFFEEDRTPLLEIKEIKSRSLVVDKTNFVHAGWFRFELYEEGRLKEKNRLFIPKDF